MEEQFVMLKNKYTHELYIRILTLISINITRVYNDLLKHIIHFFKYCDIELNN